MKRPQLTQEIIDRNYPEVIETEFDGEGIPYAQPTGDVIPELDGEDELEMLRR